MLEAICFDAGLAWQVPCLQPTVLGPAFLDRAVQGRMPLLCGAACSALLRRGSRRPTSASSSRCPRDITSRCERCACHAMQPRAACNDDGHCAGLLGLPPILLPCLLVADWPAGAAWRRWQGFGSMFQFLAGKPWGRSLLLQYPRLFTYGMFSHEGPSERQLSEASFQFTNIAKGYSKGAPWGLERTGSGSKQRARCLALRSTPLQPTALPAAAATSRCSRGAGSGARHRDRHTCERP